MGFEIARSLVMFLLNIYEKIFKTYGWELKASLLSIVEFVFNLLTLGVIIVELLVLSKRSAIGIHFVDKAIKSVSGIHQCVKNFIKSRSLLKRIDKFNDASPEEIHEANDKCIFCLDHLTQAKKINCGHLFHYKCLRDYFQQSNDNKCPTCRADIDEIHVLNLHKDVQKQNKIVASMMIEDLPKKSCNGPATQTRAVT